MATASADWQSMLAMANQVNGSAETIASQLNNLQSALETLAPQWQSDAAAAFVSLRMQWDEDARKLQASLVEISSGLTETAKRYQLADESATVRPA